LLRYSAVCTSLVPKAWKTAALARRESVRGSVLVLPPHGSEIAFQVPEISEHGA
jgi:hypothetical protein